MKHLLPFCTLHFSFCIFHFAFSILPASAAEGPVTSIAFGSCFNQDKPAPIFDTINAAKPELFIFLGDNIYADTTDMEAMKRKYGKLAGLDAFKTLKAKSRIFATWDDHDFGANDIGADYPRRAESQRVFLDFFEEPADSPRRMRPGVYNSHVFGPPGKRVQVIILDTRYFRSPLLPMDPPYRVEDPKNPEADANGFVTKTTGRNKPNPDPAATILGPQQWKWLEEQLQVPADVRILASSIQFVADDQPWEKWGNFPLEQKRFYELVAKHKAGGLLVISGDRHRAEISQTKDEPLPYTLFDYTSSGFNQDSNPDKQDEPNHRRVGPHNYIHENFGLIRIDWTTPDPAIRVEIRGIDNTPSLSHDLRLSEIKCSR